MRTPIRSFLLFVLLTLGSTASSRAEHCRPTTGTDLRLDEVSSLVQLARVASRVPAEVQDATLEAILDRVEGRRDARREDPSLPRAVIQIDLDYTVFMPVEGARMALKKLGEELGLAELITPEALPVLPAYRRNSWDVFLQDTGLLAAHPDVNWNAAFTRFNQLTAPTVDDGVNEITPGIASFVRRVKVRGGVVVFHTSRREKVRPFCLDALREAGIEKPNLVMRPDASKLASPAAKAAAQPMIRETYGETVAVIDDIAANREAIAGAIDGDVMDVPIAVPGFTTELDWQDFDSRAQRLSTFEDR